MFRAGFELYSVVTGGSADRTSGLPRSTRVQDLSQEDRISLCRYVRERAESQSRTSCQEQEIRLATDTDCGDAAQTSQCAQVTVGEIETALDGNICDLLEFSDILECVGVEWTQQQNALSPDAGS